MNIHFSKNIQVTDKQMKNAHQRQADQNYKPLG